jgi:DNA-binding response OmpR family regulator
MRALVVSSDPEHAGALAAALRRHEHHADALGAEEALAQVRRVRPELVLLDLAGLHDSAGLVRRLREA